MLVRRWCTNVTASDDIVDDELSHSDSGDSRIIPKRELDAARGRAAPEIEEDKTPVPDDDPYADESWMS